MSQDKKIMCNTSDNLEELRRILTPEQYAIAVENGTEAPFRNKYWDNHHHGIYLDVISGKPLFSSKDKFDSGSGWPSFSEPLHSEEVVEKVDKTYGMIRTEVRSAVGNGHLGHLFDDGPTGRGLRYCINSASLKFVPLEQLEAQGFVQYLSLFTKDEIADAQAHPFVQKNR